MFDETPVFFYFIGNFVSYKAGYKILLRFELQCQRHFVLLTGTR